MLRVGFPLTARVLFVSQRLPNLNGKGDQILLAKRIVAVKDAGHEVDLLVVSHQRPSAGDLYGCSHCKVIQVSVLEILLNLVVGVFRLQPFQFALFNSSRGRAYVRDRRANYSSIIGITSRSKPLLRDIPNCFIDFIDSLALNFARRSRLDSSRILRGLFWLESRLLWRSERVLALTKLGSVFVSKVDCDYLDLEGEELISPVSLFIEDYEPYRAALKLGGEYKFVFSGNMAYFPNHRSLELIITRIWPSLYAQYPSASLSVVGRGAGKELIRLINSANGVEYIGEVDNLLIELSKYHFALCPMYAGSGMQLKILEAMALGVPVITNELGLGDIKNIGQVYVARDVTEILSALRHHNWEKHKQMSDMGRHVIGTYYNQVNNDQGYLDYIKVT